MIYAKEDRPERLPPDKLILEELPSELMVYDPAREKAFCLNQTAAFVWNRSDGKTTVSEIAELMAQQLGKPVDEQVVWYALDILTRDGLLVPNSVHPQVPAGMTRRSLLRKLGAGATAVPLVTVLMVSPAQAHASSTWSDDPSGDGTWSRGYRGNRGYHHYGWFKQWF